MAETTQWEAGGGRQRGALLVRISCGAVVSSVLVVVVWSEAVALDVVVHDAVTQLAVTLAGGVGWRRSSWCDNVLDGGARSVEVVCEEGHGGRE